MIVIIDYGVGNSGSIENMINHLGFSDVIFSNCVDEINKAQGIILPGVGAFDTGMINLQQMGLITTILNFAASGKPILGICLGFQLLFESSEEGILNGLGLINGVVRKFDPAIGFKVPNIGWRLVQKKSDHWLNKEFVGQEKFYFVHSYFAECENQEDVILTSSYGTEFVCGVGKENVAGVQFHPEKSHRFGMKLLSNFISKVVNV